MNRVISMVLAVIFAVSMTVYSVTQARSANARMHYVTVPSLNEEIKKRINEEGEKKRKEKIPEKKE